MHQQIATQENDRVEVLDPGTELLRGQYVIESYLVGGGFGITYLARDSLERRVVIKECFPAAICTRDGDLVHEMNADQAGQYASVLRHFLREARRLARLSHPNIVGVHQVFEENGTAYMALDHVEGMDLLTMVEEAPETLTANRLHKILETALEAIGYIHRQGILHRDISPDNLLLGPDDRLTLIDFGAARERPGFENRALSALLAVKDGYSPHEFYLSDVPQFPSSDLYSLGATFYHLITGAPPPFSQERLAEIAAHRGDPYLPLARRGYSAHDPAFLAAIDKALAVLPRDRLQSAEDWLEALRTTPAPAATKPVILGPELQDAISRLVADTNRDLVPPQPGVKAPRRAAQGMIGFRPVIDEPQPARPPKPVDIFGNPIEDVDEWLRDQDRLSQQRLSAGRLNDEASSGSVGGKTGRESSGRGFLNKFLGRRPNAMKLARAQAVRN